jgi:hypothetical protein
LNDGTFTNDQALPVELVSFTASRSSNDDVVAEWITASEFNTARFEIELAKGNEEFTQNKFHKIGEVNSYGNSTVEQRYQFIDVEANKSGVRYYRLKIVDRDGQFSYSPIRSVLFDEQVKWVVYPNPSGGIFNLVYQAAAGEMVYVKVHDGTGKLVHQQSSTANAFVQKSIIDMSGPKFSSGLYLVEVVAGQKKQVFRVLKN